MKPLTDYKHLPSLIVFDLDYTLWPFWVDTHPTPPFSKLSNNKIVDAEGQSIKTYPDSDAILKELHNVPGLSMAVASRTMAIRPAKQLMSLLGWDKYFCNLQIFPSCKIAHFNGLKKATGIDFKDMIFFDDEHRNIVDVSSLGVTCVHASDGLSWKVLENGLEKFQVEHN